MILPDEFSVEYLRMLRALERCIISMHDNLIIQCDNLCFPKRSKTPPSTPSKRTDFRRKSSEKRKKGGISMRNKWVAKVNIVFWIIGSITILFLVGLLLVQHSFAGYRWEAINTTQDQIYATYGIQTKPLGADVPIGLIHDNAFLFNRGTSLKIGSMIFHSYYFCMEATQGDSPISFKMSNSFLIEHDMVRIKNTDVTITYTNRSGIQGEKAVILVSFNYHIGSYNYFGIIQPTSESPNNDHYYFGEKMVREEKDVIEGMIAELIG
jgi:hypothetical protein